MPGLFSCRPYGTWDTAGYLVNGYLSAMARMPFPGPWFLTSLGRVGLGVDGHHARGRGGRGLCTAPVPFKLCDPCISFGNAFSRSQKCQDDDFGIVLLAESQRLRSCEFTAHRGVD